MDRRFMAGRKLGQLSSQLTTPWTINPILRDENVYLAVFVILSRTGREIRKLSRGNCITRRSIDAGGISSLQIQQCDRQKRALSALKSSESQELNVVQEVHKTFLAVWNESQLKQFPNYSVEKFSFAPWNMFIVSTNQCNDRYWVVPFFLNALKRFVVVSTNGGAMTRARWN